MTIHSPTAPDDTAARRPECQVCAKLRVQLDETTQEFQIALADGVRLEDRSVAAEMRAERLSEMITDILGCLVDGIDGDPLVFLDRLAATIEHDYPSESRAVYDMANTLRASQSAARRGCMCCGAPPPRATVFSARVAP